MKPCPTCKGEGYTMVDENPIDCNCYPIFKQHGSSFNKVLSDSAYLEVYTESCISPASIGVFNVEKNVEAIMEHGDDITEQQFLEAYEKAVYEIKLQAYPISKRIPIELAY